MKRGSPSLGGVRGLRETAESGEARCRLSRPPAPGDATRPFAHERGSRKPAWCATDDIVQIPKSVGRVPEKNRGHPGRGGKHIRSACTFLSMAASGRFSGRSQVTKMPSLKLLSGFVYGLGMAPLDVVRNHASASGPSHEEIPAYNRKYALIRMQMGGPFFPLVVQKSGSFNQRLPWASPEECEAISFSVHGVLMLPCLMRMRESGNRPEWLNRQHKTYDRGWS